MKDFSVAPMFTSLAFLQAFSRSAVWLLLVLLFLLVPRTGSAGVILVIDVSNPAEVIFTATDVHSESDDDETWLMEGISLIGFFENSVDDPTIYFFDVPSDLWSPGGAFAYSQLVSINFSDPLSDSYFDLSVFGSGFSTQNFSTEEPALWGSATADLTAWMTFLPAPGTTGAVYSGDEVSSKGPLIGQYLVVPEPSAGALLGVLGILAWAKFRRRR